MKDGIVFDMPEDEYLAIPRLSKSAIKKLRISAADYWAESPLNPNPPILTPEQEKNRAFARMMGRAYHVGALEPDRFRSIYFRELSQGDFAGREGVLFTGAQIEAQLAARDLPKKSKDDTEGVLSQARRLAAAGYEFPIWHLEYEDFQKGLPEVHRLIPARQYEELTRDVANLRLDPDIREAMEGGLSEVSVFYTCRHTGLPMKARFDKLKHDRWVELKTFSNGRRASLLQTISDAMRYERYYIDAASYMEAAEAIRTGGLPIVGEASEAERDTIAAIQLSPHELECTFIFQQTGGVPNVLRREFDFHDVPVNTSAQEAGASPDQVQRMREATRTRTLIYQKALNEIMAAKRLFMACMETFSPGEPWRPFKAGGRIGDLDFNTYWLEEEISQ